MRFKLLHVRPHVWFFKQQEAIKAGSDDDSSSTEGSYVYKRSTPLKLVKSDPSAERRKFSGNTPDVKPTSNSTTLSTTKHTPKKGKNVQVCTVVDAGCTCRATVSSQHKQRNSGSSCVSSRDVGSLHDVCRPRGSQVLEVKADKDGAAPLRHAHLHVKANSSSPGTLRMNDSMISRLICKSSHDVIKHTHGLTAEHNRMTCISTHGEDRQFDACVPQVRHSKSNAVQLDVHELECRLRNAGLEERRRSSKKKNKLYYEEGSLTSSGVSSSLGTSANTDTLLTTTTSEVQDMLLNANPAFDTDVLSMGDRMACLDDLRASIAQGKLATFRHQASLCAENLVFLDGLSDNVTLSGSPSSFSSESIRPANGDSPRQKRKLDADAHEEKQEVSVKHVDGGVTKKVGGFESDDIANPGLVKQRHKVSRNTSSKVNDACRDHEAASRRAAQRLDLGTQREADVVLQRSGKSRVNRPTTCSTQGQRSESNKFNLALARGGKNTNEANSREADIDKLELERRILHYPEGDIEQEKQVLSSSSCEIQVLSDCNHENPCNAAHSHPPTRIHVGGSSSTSDAGPRPSEEGALANELMRSDSAVAMVKSSYDPGCDFKESMLEMVVAKRLRAPRQLQQLLECYISLNPSQYHPIIIKVFHELCNELFK